MERKEKSPIVLYKTFPLVPTCVIHRLTLINKEICFKCCLEKKEQDHEVKILKKDIFLVELRFCSFCFQQMYESSQVYCPDCFQCPKKNCGKYSHFPGFCTWCKDTFDHKIFVSTLNKNSSWFVKYLIQPEWMFITSTAFWFPNNVSKIILSCLFFPF